MDGGAWRAAGHGVEQSQTGLKPLTTHYCHQQQEHLCRLCHIPLLSRIPLPDVNVTALISVFRTLPVKQTPELKLRNKRGTGV